MARHGCRDCPADQESPSHSLDLDRELIFHYDRSQREALRRYPLEDHSGNNPFRGNRSLLILAIDVLVVLLLAGFYFYVLRGDPSETVIDGYRFSLEGRRFDEGVLVSLTVLSEDGDAAPGEPFYLRLSEPPPERARRLLEGGGETPADVRRLLEGEKVFDLLPTDGERTVRLLLPGQVEGGELTLEVGRGEESGEVTVVLEELSSEPD
ncbi:MAG: hypothetical protein ACOCRY_00505 [Alkalispirochaetaceae bacterium]